MKVSGDNPVFVESVKPGLAAQKAGLMAGDMILKVNGQHVRYSSHLEVVKLIKASELVNLTILRGHSHSLQQQPRPMSTSMSNSPSTPVAQRSSITAPLPVDVSIFSFVDYVLNILLDNDIESSKCYIFSHVCVSLTYCVIF